MSGAAGGIRHQELVADLIRVRGGCRTTGFWAAAKECLAEMAEVDNTPEVMSGLVDRLNPDAWYVESDGVTFHVFEVEITRPLPAEKQFKYAWLWFTFDCYDMDLKLHIINRYGQESEIHLVDWYYKLYVANGAAAA